MNDYQKPDSRALSTTVCYRYLLVQATPTRGTQHSWIGSSSSWTLICRIAISRHNVYSWRQNALNKICMMRSDVVNRITNWTSNPAMSPNSEGDNPQHSPASGSDFYCSHTDLVTFLLFFKISEYCFYRVQGVKCNVPRDTFPVSCDSVWN